MPYSEKALEHRRAYSREWRRTHKKEVSAYNHAYGQAHKDEIVARHKRNRKSNPERVYAYKRTEYKKHRDKILLHHKTYRENHLQDEKTRHHDYYEKHREQILVKVKAYRQQHPEVARSTQRRYRANKYGAAVNTLTAAQWNEIKAAYGHRCVYCGRKMKHLTQDHITPLSKGGNHCVDNVVPACQSCNSKKAAGVPLTPIQPLLLTIA